MNRAFEFFAPGAAGHSVNGTITGVVDSFSNTCVLDVRLADLADPFNLAPRDPITVDAVTEGIRFPVFSGVVSAIRPRGSDIRIEAVTSSAYMMVGTVSKMSWANVSAMQVVRDLIQDAGLSLADIAIQADLEGIFLHVWQTDGMNVADEIRHLLDQVAPSYVCCGALDGRVMIGDRGYIAGLCPSQLYPVDESTGQTDLERARFSLRAAVPGSACFAVGVGYVGTLDSVEHVIRPGDTHTDFALDSRPDVSLSSFSAAA